jgi:hypothetical protein
MPGGSFGCQFGQKAALFTTALRHLTPGEPSRPTVFQRTARKRPYCAIADRKCIDGANSCAFAKTIGYSRSNYVIRTGENTTRNQKQETKSGNFLEAIPAGMLGKIEVK